MKEQKKISIHNLFFVKMISYTFFKSIAKTKHILSCGPFKKALRAYNGPRDLLVAPGLHDYLQRIKLSQGIIIIGVI
jgi:hypothetical protein